MDNSALSPFRRGPSPPRVKREYFLTPFQGPQRRRQQRTDWHRIVVFGKLAENCAQYLSKGRQIYVEGRLTTREYEAKDGSGNRYRTEIVARHIRFLGRHTIASDTTADNLPADQDVPF